MMALEIDRVLAKVNPKVKVILRTEGFYRTSSLIQQFRAHVLPLLECTSGACFHAAASCLGKLDWVQTKLLRELGLSMEQAVLEFRLALLPFRRRIWMLGFLYKIRRCPAHPVFSTLFPASEVLRYHTKHVLRNAPSHPWQISVFCEFAHSEQFHRSIFGMVHGWNHLPHADLSADSVSGFRRLLTRIASRECETGSKWTCFSMTL